MESQDRMQDLMIDVRELKKNYGPVQAVRGASFQVKKGEIIALLGPNGAGKTTVMKILTGFLEASQGEVRIDGLDIESARTQVQERIGYLPENAPIYGEMLVQDYLLFVGRLRGIAEEGLFDCMAEAVVSTGLQEVLTRPIGELSKGFRQRVGLAQAILHRPKLLILDEPTNGLDPTQIVEIRNLIKRLAKNATVMLSTHILSEAEATCDRAIIVIQGQVRADAQLNRLSDGAEVILGMKNTAAVNPEEVRESLKKIQGIGEVRFQRTATGDLQFRMVSAQDGLTSQALALNVFDRVRERNWPIFEIKPESKTLEAVFKELNA